MSAPAGVLPEGVLPDGGVPTFRPPCDTDRLDETVRVFGAAILKGVISAELHTGCRSEIDRWFEEHPRAANRGGVVNPHTVHLPKLVARIPSAAKVVGGPHLLGLARRMLAPLSARVRLGSVDYLERTPGERSRSVSEELDGLHRGTEAWPLPVGRNPVAVQAIVPLSAFTVANGTMWLASGSQWLPAGDRPHPRTLLRAIAEPGDVLVFRADVLHCQGTNVTDDQRLRTISICYQVDWLCPADHSPDSQSLL